MIDLYEALEALKKTGTMGKAGVLLRISQSAVSKRIAALEETTGKILVERQGRLVAITEEGHRLIEKIAPLISEIKFELGSEKKASAHTYNLGVSESVLASWGARVIFQAQKMIIGTTFALHAHRGPLLVHLVASGTYAAGIVAGEPGASSLQTVELGSEPMVLLKNPNAANHLISIEPGAATWQAIKNRATKLGLIPDQFVESYFSAANLALAGFGQALVPAGVARSLKMAKKIEVIRLDKLNRPIHLLARKHLIVRPEFQQLIDILRKDLKAIDWAS